jgi:glycosyltransferase involved in cell wall biosynthesis
MESMKIFVVDLESVPTRYTCEWKQHLPAMLRREIEAAGLDIEVINISGGEESIEASPGAFLNFQATNIYKNNQMNDIARRFTSEIRSGDKFLFADAWHTGILQLKYMSDLLGIPVEIHALWHAGSYDPHDFLGRLVHNKAWSYSTERAIYHSVDYNWFATKFHENMFGETLFGSRNQCNTYNTGWPMDYMPSIFAEYDGHKKEDIIIFPHRVAPEKQPEIFRDLAASLPEYQFVVCQDEKLPKNEYHRLLAKSKLLWSANLQETLGISPFEGALMGVFPYLPDRLSYSEMYEKKYLYPSIWTESYAEYLKYKHIIIDDIKYIMSNYDTLSIDVRNKLAPSLLKDYFTSTKLIEKLLRN